MLLLSTAKNQAQDSQEREGTADGNELALALIERGIGDRFADHGIECG